MPDTKSLLGSIEWATAYGRTKRAVVNGIRLAIPWSILVVVWCLPGTWERAYSQIIGTELTGIVSDSSGARIPEAAVTVTNQQTGARRELLTNAEGFFAVQSLAPGSYRVDVEKPGFKKFARLGLLLQTGQAGRVDVRLEVGEVSESVEVTGAAPLIQTDTTGVIGLLGSAQIERLPNISRTPMNTVFQINALAATSDFLPRVGGSERDGAGYYLDGSNGNMRGDVQVSDAVPSEDVVTEVSLVTGVYSAEYHGTYIVSMTSKQGTNAYHGSAYWYHQDSALNAKPWGAASKGTAWRTNTPGGAFGGPIYKDRTHFFFNYQWSKSNRPSPVTLTVPSLTQREGDFSNLFNAAGNLVTIYDPLTARRDPNDLTRIVRDPFPGNRIPTNRIDPVARNILAYIPRPNRAGDATGAANFIFDQMNESTSTQMNARVDHMINSSNRVFVRYTNTVYDGKQIGYQSEPGADAFWNSNPDLIGANITGGYDLTLGTNLLSQTYFTYTNRPWRQVNPGIGLGFPRKLGLKGADPDACFPSISVSGYLPIGLNPFSGTGCQANQLHMSAYNLSQKVAYVQGSHNFKTGVEIQKSNPAFWFRPLPSGQASFGPIGPSNKEGGGNAFASFLLGWAGSGQIVDNPTKESVTWYYSPWFQDDWRIRPNLTINLGLRWEIDTPQNFGNQVLSGFDRKAINPVSGTPGVVTFSRTGTSGDAIYELSWKKFSPRIGVSWQPGGAHSKTVIRGGWALIFEVPVQQSAGGSWQSPSAGVATQGSFSPPDEGFSPAFQLSTGFPPIPAGEALTPAFGAVEVGKAARFSPSFYESNDPFPRIHRLGFEVQRQLASDIVISAGYVGAIGRKLRLWGVNINEIPIEQAGPGFAQARRPFPQFGGITYQNPPLDTSDYHAMELKAQKRFSGGLQFNADYVWAKMLDSRTQYRTFYNLAINRGPTVGERRHRFALSGAYDLPFGPGKSLVQSGPVSHVIGGWQLGYIVTLQVGTPLTINSINAPGTNTFARQGVDQVGDWKVPHPSMDAWFNTAAFVNPAAYRFGFSQGVVYGPGQRDADFSLRKNFHLTERFRFQVRSDFQNLFNHSNLSNPNTSLGSAGFGRIFSKYGNRAIQVGLKLEF